MKMINIDLLTTWRECETLEQEWNALLLQSDANSVFLTWEWLSSWCNSLGKEACLWIMLARHAETHQLLGIAPMMINYRKIQGVPLIRELVFLGSGIAAPDHVDFILHHAYRDELITEMAAFLRDQKKIWDIVHLESCRNNADALKILSYLNQRIDCYPIICPYLALPKSWTDYLQGLDKKRRTHSNKIRSSQRKLAEAYPGQVTYQCVSADDDVDTAIGELCDLHRQSQQLKGRAGIFAFEKNKAFHRLLIKRFLANDWLRLYFLRVDNKAIAVLYNFKYNGIFSFYTTGFEYEYKAFRPGLQLFYYAFEQAIIQGASEFDFLRGAEDYKYTMTTTARNDIRIIVPCTVSGKITAYFYRMRKSYQVYE